MVISMKKKVIETLERKEIQLKYMEDKKIVWTQELQDELKKDIENLNENFNLEKLEQLINDETK